MTAFCTAASHDRTGDRVAVTALLITVLTTVSAGSGGGLYCLVRAAMRDSTLRPW